MASWTPSYESPDFAISGLSLELAPDGRMYHSSSSIGRGFPISITRTGRFRVEKDTLYDWGMRPAQIRFVGADTLRLEIEGDIFELYRRPPYPIRGLDIVGAWTVEGDSLSTIEFLTATAGCCTLLRFQSGTDEFGTWAVSAEGLHIRSQMFGDRTYSQMNREGDCLTLSGDDGTLVLTPYEE